MKSAACVDHDIPRQDGDINRNAHRGFREASEDTTAYAGTNKGTEVISNNEGFEGWTVTYHS
jgi:hypothetical protein